MALVGGSGNGKTTCLQLLQRFYDPDEGQISIDDYDIRTLNVSVLRSIIATVGQEPVLFSATIGENIRYGKPNASEEDVIDSAKMAGAHDFITEFPLGYDTLVGEKGSQLSGGKICAISIENDLFSVTVYCSNRFVLTSNSGQKQRIAIARALIQNPKILLLDEATSALDYQSEKFIQETLDKVSKGRTTIIVSHRLSAIRNASRILFIDNGLIVEDGTHSKLMELKGRYFDMISAGQLEDSSDNTEDSANKFKANNELHSYKDQCEKQDQIHNLCDDYTEESEEDSTDEVEQNINYWAIFKRILFLIRSKWLIMFLATLSSCFIGATLPIFSILYADVYGASVIYSSPIWKSGNNFNIFISIVVIVREC